MGKDWYDHPTSTTTADTPDRAAVERVHGADEANRLFNKDRIANALYDTPAPVTGPELHRFETSIAGDIDRNIAKRVPRERLTAAQQAAEKDAYLAMITRLGLDVDAAFAIQLHDKLTTAKLAEQRPGVDAATLDLEARRTSEETYARLRGRWGQDFDGLLARVTKYVEADPEFAAALGTGPGADYDVLNELMEHVQRVGYR